MFMHTECVKYIIISLQLYSVSVIPLHRLLAIIISVISKSNKHHTIIAMWMGACTLTVNIQVCLRSGVCISSSSLEETYPIP